MHSTVGRAPRHCPLKRLVKIKDYGLDSFCDIHIKYDKHKDERFSRYKHAKAHLKQMELLGNTAVIALIFSGTLAVSRYCFCLWK